MIPNKKIEKNNTRISHTNTENDCYVDDSLDEFSDMHINKVNTISMKDNDINNVDKRNNNKLSYKKEIFLNEPDNFIDPVINNKILGGHSRNLSSSNNQGPINKMLNSINSNLTPNKNKAIPYGNYTPAPRNLNFGNNNVNCFNSNLIFNKSNNFNNHPSSISNMGNRMIYNNQNNHSFISQSNYSSSNKMRDGNGIENEDSTEIGDYSHEE
jgi:hypothetical protein